MASYPLKYTFEARFKDGSVYRQNFEDAPQISPTGSAFTDIKDRIDDISEFCLFDLNGDLCCLVSLQDGHFEVKGQFISAQDPSVTLPLDTVYRLIYFRRVSHCRQGDSIYLESVFYHIGWQTTIDDKNYQQTIAIT